IRQTSDFTTLRPVLNVIGITCGTPKTSSDPEPCGRPDRRLLAAPAPHGNAKPGVAVEAIEGRCVLGLDFLALALERRRQLFLFERQFAVEDEEAADVFDPGELRVGPLHRGGEAASDLRMAGDDG